jgi:hypothetical protein
MGSSQTNLNQNVSTDSFQTGLVPQKDIFNQTGVKDISDLSQPADIDQSEKESTTDITEYIFEKLQNFGYPPRRLEEFETEFVKQKFYPGENKEVTIVIPDRYYGMRKSLSDKDIKTIISEMSEKFGLSFTEGEREDKKITLNFISQQEAEKIKSDSEEDSFVGDELDEIYGSPSKDKSKSKKVKAFTALELVKMGRDNWIHDFLNKKS